MSPETFTTIARVGDVDFGMTGTTVDVTAQDSGEPWTQQIVTILNGGPVNIPIFFLPDDTGHQALLDLFTDRGQGGVAGVPINFRITFPTAVPKTWQFSGFFNDFSVKAAVKGVVTGSLKIAVTSAVDFNV